MTRTGEQLRAQRPFVLFSLARVFAMIAHQMLAVGVGWQMYALTGSALDLGLVGLAQFIPAFFLVLVAGHAADHFDRRRVLQACMVFEARAALGLCIGSAYSLLSAPAIFALIFVVGVARAFQMPTMQALLPALVPVTLLSRAIAANASASQAAIIAGPAIGGVIYVAGAAAVYGASTALFLLTGCITHAIKQRQATVVPTRATGLSRPHGLASFPPSWSALSGRRLSWCSGCDSSSRLRTSIARVAADRRGNQACRARARMPQGCALTTSPSGVLLNARVSLQSSEDENAVVALIRLSQRRPTHAFHVRPSAA